MSGQPPPPGSTRPTVGDDERAAEFDLSKARAVAAAAARDAGELLRQRLPLVRQIRHKGAIDIVTDADEASEQLIRQAIRAVFPTHSIVGEEAGAVVGVDPRFRWIVDPLDGTTNYAHGFPFFCVSIALEVEGTLALGAVYDPTLDELFLAERGRGATLNGAPIQVSTTPALELALLATGFPYDRRHFPRALAAFEAMSLRSLAVRRAGSAALDLCFVACGRLDGYFEWMVMPWDVAAGGLLVLEAGGSLTAADGSPFTLEGGSVLASNGLLHAPMAQTLRALGKRTG